MPRATPMAPADRRAMIMDATEPLLREHGRDVSTRQIAEAAGVAEGTLFRVFDSKDDLIDAVLERAFGTSVTQERLAAIDPEKSLHARLIHVTAIVQQRMIESFTLFHAIRPVTDKPPAEMAAERKAFQQRLTADSSELNRAMINIVGNDEAQLGVPAAVAVPLLRALIFSLSHPFGGHVHGFQVDPPAPEAIVELLLFGTADPHRPGRTIDLADAFGGFAGPAADRRHPPRRSQGST